MNTMLVRQETVKQARPLVDRLMEGVVFASPVLFTIEDIFVRLADGRMQLWLFYDEEPYEAHLCVVTLMEKFPCGNIAHVFLMAGSSFRDAIRFRPNFEAWCKAQGADYIHFECSPKMAKVMKRFGYHAVAMAVYKPLHVAN